MTKPLNTESMDNEHNASPEVNRHQVKEYFWENEWFDVTDIRPGLKAVREPHHGEDVLAFILENNEGIILIDSGMGLANIKNLLPSNKPVTLLLTHTHWDHIGCVGEFQDIRVFDHPFETERLKMGWLPTETVGYEKAEFKETIPMPANYDPAKTGIPGISEFTTFQDGEELNIFGTTIQVIHTPGHTPGGVCFWLPETGELFTGDTVYDGPIYLQMQESDWPAFRNSIRKLHAFTEGKIQKILPGHNSPQNAASLLYEFHSAVNGISTPRVDRGVSPFGNFKSLKFNYSPESFTFYIPLDADFS